MAVASLLGHGEEQAQYGRKVFFDVADDELLELRFTLNLFDRVVEVAHNEHQFSAGIVHLVLYFAMGVQRIGCHCDTAGFQNRIKSNDKLGRVRHKYRDAVAFLHTAGNQCGCQTIAEIVHLTKSDYGPFENGTGPIGKIPRRLFKKVLEPQCRYFDFSWHTFIVMLMPDSFIHL